MNMLRPIAAGLCLLLTGCAALRGAGSTPAPTAALVDDAVAARQLLEREREDARRGGASAARLRLLTRLGLWEEADAVAAQLPETAPADARVAEAELRFRQHQYPRAQQLVDAVLAAAPSHRAARLLQARLQVQAWRLDAAAATVEALLRDHPRDEDAALLRGRIHLLGKRYDEALRWAERVQQWNPSHAGGHLLEADVRFWNQDPAGAEAPLRRALTLDPLDPDARFSYGYAIWRRVDATQLDAMADQWALALEVDPLHYVTHWHWGNGHTNLTYADYAQPTDSVVRARLAPADSLIAARRVADAIALSREVERDFPESVLPAMLRASAWYMAWDDRRAASLDSAQATFGRILQRKRNYGPAHNGLAAVIKQRQFGVLAAYDSLQAEIAAVPLDPDPALDAVFPDARFYPGDRVQKMVRLELGPSRAYLPLIQRQGREYRIPPLHRDLAEAMGQPFFRTATTFDNRQWMDIRGVGSGAAAIEYVERGAYQERNVLLHEYVHLFHGIVFTDQEVRRVRELYHDAMREGRTLDYYAANNEHEFLAQAYPAFLSPVKVHPLNHKSMNTRADLLQRDPATYAFVDSLIARQRAYMAGDRGALGSNWAQVYVNLSEQRRADRERERAQRVREAAVLLDSALVWDPAYLPAMLSYSALHREQGRFGEAEGWLARAEALDPGYAPIFRARAALVGARDGAASLDTQVALLRRALRLDRDLAIRAELSSDLRELFLAHGRLPDAIREAREYVEDAPTISTYLRDRRDEAAAQLHALRSRAGYAAETLPFFRQLVDQKPQNYDLRAQYADALLMARRPAEAAATLEEAQRILLAGGSADVRLAARLAMARLAQGDSAAAREALAPVLAGRGRGREASLLVVRALAAVGQTTEAHRRLAELPEPVHPAARAELELTRGALSEWREDEETAERAYRAALSLDPYLGEARRRLWALLHAQGRAAEADAVRREAQALELAPGPEFWIQAHGRP